MKKTQERTLTITCTEGNEVTKKQHSCFVHNLIADAMRTKPLITWKRDPKVEPGTRAYYTNGLAAGTLITLRGLDAQPGVKFTYSRHDQLIYEATELAGDVNCDMHLTMLLHKVICAVTWAEAAQKQDPLTQMKEAVDKKLQTPQQELSAIHVGDMFRKVTADQMVDRILRKPSMLSINVAEGSPEFTRLETLIRAVIAYIQAVRPKETGLLLKGFALKSVTGDRRVCGHTMLSPMADIANAHVELDERYYGGLKPAEQTEKFVADVVVNMLIGI